MKLVFNKMNNKAITLIALVITIVVLIILAAVAINLSLGNNGIFNRAKTGKELYQNAEKYDDSEVAKATNQVDSLVGGNRETVTVDKDEYDAIKAKADKFGKTLWEGEWTSGSITVPGISDYTTCIARSNNGYIGQFDVQSGSICLMMTYYESSMTKTFILNKMYTISGDTLTTIHGSCYGLTNQGSTWKTGSVASIERNTDVVTKIVGLY